MIVALRRLAQQTVIPVAVADFAGGIQIAFFQISCTGIKADLRFLFSLRFFALNIHQSSWRTAAIQHRGGPFQNIDAFHQQRVDTCFGVASDVVRQLQAVVVLLIDRETANLVLAQVGGIAAHFCRHPRRIAQDLVDGIRMT